ncbi:hypothetical protein M885DRAFT_557622 [Pelagophyceae sp. CCMP2097]|nr:hypothetical protein M885DRAFT_557622 [Pelagophyceae sp. CCMP2097]|mmetsp:Transcript_9261/g.31952  ORF Transcript_9261/g.31952 Transcript_9261/m.31952 type:complete len:153 (+) Transcript_9261:226-684(+)
MRVSSLFLFAVGASAFAPRRGVAGRRSLAAAVEVEAPPEVETSRVITVTPDALVHIAQLRTSGSGDTLRVGVRAGGCSGMSYTMDFCDAAAVAPEDHVEEWPEGFKVVIDPKSILFLFGLELGYSSELIGGGFKFSNPNAEGSCGCGSSFNI